MTKQITHNGQITIPIAGFEPAIPASLLPQTHALESAADIIDFLFPL
jgi:hypothetical protein